MRDNEIILKEQLATLLSFDLEDVGDVFEPLLEFDSEEDLLEYMSALLGGYTEEIQIFVKNIIRFQKGLPLLTPDQDNTSKDCANKHKEEEKKTESNITKPSAPQKSLPSEIPQKSRKQQEAVKIEREKKEKKREQDGRRKRNEDQRQQLLEQHQKQQEEALLEFKKKQEKERINLELAKSIAEMTVTDEVQQEPRKIKKTAVTKPSSSVKPQPVKKARPLKGKAKVVCGCFGTVHKALTNCLNCGRISCAKEGHDYCPHCSNLIENVAVSSIPGEVDEAMLHKERLLKFDRESAKRTAVFDDQADYFQNSTSTWLTDNEQQEARSKDERRRRDLHTIKKHVLNIDF